MVRAGAVSAALALVLGCGSVLAPAPPASAAPAPAGADPLAEVPEGIVAYRSAADFTTTGKPRDLLLHPESKKLYVGSEDLPGTTEVNENGLYVLNPADGSVRGIVGQLPGPTGALGRRAVSRLIAPLPGDGVALGFPLRGIGTAREGDAAVAGAWVSGGTVTDAAPGVTPGTVLLAQGPVLSEVDLATAAVRRSLTLEGGDGFAVDPARKAVWFTDARGHRLYRIDTDTFQVSATVDLPAGEGFAGFTEVDPRTGAVWVGIDTSVVVHDATGRRVRTLAGTDLPRAARFDPVTKEVFVIRQDAGDPSQPGSDNDGTLTVYRTADFQEATTPVRLPRNQSQLGWASLAVEPGGGVVFVSNPAEGRITRLERTVSPKVTRSPADRTVAAGARVTLNARADGTPTPTVLWQESADDGLTWQDVPGSGTADHAFTARPAHDGHRFRAEFRNDGGAARSAVATLTVSGPEGGPGGGPGGDPTGGAGSVNGASGEGTSGPTGTSGTTGSPDASGSVGSSGSAGSSDVSGSGAPGGFGALSGPSGPIGPIGSVGGAGATPTGGSLASTGAVAAPLAGAAAALTGAGWLLVRRRRAAANPR
ncbi:hypothetical protein ACIRP0_05095 [Streptomyces sp. NPDC101733]|uniref:hypothetical protein n=1 Tax=unclassified Streptomyces TaxID=2593676 RepID=UPI0038046A6E